MLDPTLPSHIARLRKTISANRARLAEKKGTKTQLLRTRQSLNDQLDTTRQEQKNHEQAAAFLMSELTQRRLDGIKSIEDITTSVLQIPYGDDFFLRFETFDEKRSKEGEMNYRMEMKIVRDVDGVPQYLTLTNGQGGGLTEVVSFGSLLATLEWLGYKGPVWLDEAWKSMSKDQKIDALVQFVSDYQKTSGRQMILTTHMLKDFGPVADNIVYLEEGEDGRVTARSVTFEEAMALRGEGEEWQAQ